MSAPIGNKFALGNEGGRPTLYKEAYNQQAYKLCLLGYTDEELADFFNVNIDTIKEWKNVHVEFSASISAGKENADMLVIDSLYNSAQDRTVKEQQAIKVKRVYYDEQGKKVEEEKIEIIEVEKVIPSDFRSQQFWLKNRQSKKWRDKQEFDTQGSLVTTIQIINPSA
jgi:uncharacterized protein YjcR